LKTPFPALALLAILTACRDKDDVVKKPEAATAKPADTDDDGPGVSLKPDAQKLAGLKVAALSEQALQPQLVAYGRLEEDPSGSFTVRASAAGTLLLAPGKLWPALGQTLPAHAEFGIIQPRLLLSDRLTLNTQLSAARTDLNSSQSAVTAAQVAYDRARVLNADNKNISDRAVQEAAAKLASEKAREAGARALIQVLESSLNSAAASDVRQVIAERGGDVVEVLAQPGETIEQGAPIVRLAQLDRLLARIDLPVGEHLPATSTTALIVPAGMEDQPPLAAERITATAVTDVHSLGASLLYRLSQTRPGLRPGAPVTARFTLPGTSGEGFLIPRSALVQQDGRLWVYVQTKDDRFARKPVTTGMPTSAGFLVERGFSAGDRLVTTGAQTLLSEEFKSKNEADTN
jgi:membrane fusion protein, multidrug efflux system